MAAAGGTATCFVVGYFAKRFPHLIREAVAAGHEIASHSYFHRLAYEMSAEGFYEDAWATRKLLEDVSGHAVRGFRAPAFSFTKQTPWFFEKLAEAGYGYDSSVFPAPHQTGGLETNRLAPHRLQTPAGTIAEFPITAVRVFGRPMCFFGAGICGFSPTGSFEAWAMPPSMKAGRLYFMCIRARSTPSTRGCLSVRAGNLPAT